MSWIPALGRAARYGAQVGRLGNLNRPFQGSMDTVRRFGASRLRPNWEAQAGNEAREASRISRLRPRYRDDWTDRVASVLDKNYMGTVGGFYAAGSALAGYDYARKQPIGSDTSTIKSTYSSSNFGKKVDNDRQAIYDRWKAAEESRKRYRAEEGSSDVAVSPDTFRSGARGGRKIDYKVKYDYN